MRFSLVIFLLFLFTGYLTSQNTNQVKFIRSYNVDANSYGGNIEQTDDRGYITAGAYLDSIPDGWGGFNVVEIVSLVKTDSMGIAQWIKSYNIGATCAYGGAAIKTYDGGYAYTTTYTDSTGLNPDVFLFKTDSLGNVLWSKSYGGQGREYAMGIVQSPDSGYAIIAYSNTHTMVRGDYYLVKTDKSGNYMFGKRYDFRDYEDFPLYILRSKSGYLMMGLSTFSDTIAYQNKSVIYVVKTDWNGNVKWNKAYNYSNNYGYAYPGNFRETHNGKLIFTGYKSDTLSNITSLFLLKTDSLGNPIFSKEYWLSDSLYSNASGSSIVEDYDKGYVISGYATGNNYNGYSILLKTDSLGTPLYCNAITSDSSYMWITNITKAKDKGTIATGSSYFAGYHLGNIKYDSLGKTGCSDSLINLKKASFNFTLDADCNVNNIGSMVPRPMITHTVAPNCPYSCVAPIDTTTPPHTDPPPHANSNNTYYLSIPNIFSPNNDAINDEWFVNSKGYTGEIFIYNRWGEKVFNTKDITENWNGHVLNRGNKCSDGTYFYIINCKNEVLKKHERYKGFILLEQ